jgi:adenine-specific DNA-methyltransferase
MVNENYMERYEFTWPGKKKAILEADTPTTTVLCPFREESKDWDTTENLYIEGDNLDALKLLKEGYAGKVKMIYIDPPYNTRKNGIYKDNFTISQKEYEDRAGAISEEDRHLLRSTDPYGRFHSDWCSMMYPRLALARNLLRDDGVIFISIDDNEVTNLTKICDEVFGADNYINTIALKTKASAGASGGGEDKRLKKNAEFILIYAKNKSGIDMQQPIEKIRISDFIEEHKQNNIGFYYTRILDDIGEKTLIKEIGEMKIFEHKYYKFSTISEKIVTENLSLDQAYSKYFDRIFMVTNAQTSILTKVNDFTPNAQMLISYEYIPKTGKDKNKLTTKFIWNKTLVVWFADSAEKFNNSVFKYENMGTLWDDISWGRLDLQGDVPFKNGKKPLKLLERLLQMQTENDSIILDFFSGSATTAHAVMQLNAEDGGHRKFIMVQLQEPCDEKSEAFKAGYKNICEIGKERIRRAGEKIKEENKDKSGIEKLDTGFRVLKILNK